MNNTITITSPSQQISESLRDALTNIDKIQKASLNARKYANLASSLDTTSINDSLKKAIDFRSSFDNETFTANITEALRVTNSDAFKQITQSLDLSKSINIAKAFSLQSVMSQPIVAPLNIPSDEYIESHPQINEVKSELNKTMFDTYAPPSYKETLSMKLSNLIFFASYTIDAEYIKHYAPFIREQVLGAYIDNELDGRFNSVAVVLITIFISFVMFNIENKKDTD